MRFSRIFEIVYIFIALFILGASNIFASTAYVPYPILHSTLSVNPNEVINTLFRFGFIVIGLIFFLIVIISGIEWIIGAGDEKKRDSAKSRLSNAFIGIAIVAGSFLIVEIVGSLFGISSIFSKNLFTNNCPPSSIGGICLNK